MKSTLHFFTVFNPLLKPTENHLTQAHEFHHMLKQRVEVQGPKAQVYWGKIKKTDKNPPLDIEAYKAVVNENKRAGRDTHLFISDFNFFWVAKVEEVTTKRPKPAETLSIYEAEDVEIWFKIKDMDLIADHPCATREEIARLSSGEHRSLTPYLSGLRYPLIVDDISSERHFQKYKDQKRVLLSNSLLTKKTIPREQVSYTIPRASFEKLPELLKKKIIWAEELFAQIHERDVHYQQKLSAVAVAHLQILTALLNNSLMREIELRIDSTKDFYSLSQIHDVLNRFSWQGYNVDEIMSNTLHEEFWRFCKIDVRNFLHQNAGPSAVHALGPDVLLPTGAALYIRNSMLGVGCRGILNEIIERYTPLEKLVYEEVA